MCFKLDASKIFWAKRIVLVKSKGADPEVGALEDTDKGITQVYGADPVCRNPRRSLRG